jgi:hypothetical protein
MKLSKKTVNRLEKILIVGGSIWALICWALWGIADPTGSGANSSAGFSSYYPPHNHTARDILFGMLITGMAIFGPLLCIVGEYKEKEKNKILNKSELDGIQSLGTQKSDEL